MLLVVVLVSANSQHHNAPDSNKIVLHGLFKQVLEYIVCNEAFPFIYHFGNGTTHNKGGDATVEEEAGIPWTKGRACEELTSCCT